MSVLNKFKTNIAGKVRNTKLPKKKALWPLFEVISNAIHAIEEKGNSSQGRIVINIIRNGKPELLKAENNLEQYPINSFEVIDNGIGFTDLNYQSFLTAESDYKIEKGAKGIGRFVSLKAFNSVIYNSTFNNKGTNQNRSFHFRASGDGIFEYKLSQIEKSYPVGTSITLNSMKEEYQRHIPQTLDFLAEKIVMHFLIYFLRGKAPYIELKEVNGQKLLLQNYYESTIKGSTKKGGFLINEHEFDLRILRVFNTKTGHTIHYCANDREVKKDRLSEYILDLGKKIEEEDGNYFVYHVYVISDFLDNNVDSDRTDFDLHSESESEEDTEITLRTIRKNTVEKVEELLATYLEKVRAEKFNEYEQHIYQDAPQFKSLLKHRKDSVKRMAPNLKGNKLDIELFKVQHKFETEIKELGEQVLSKPDGYSDKEEYKEKYNEYIEKMNDLGKANLAKYIVHRKSIIELLDTFLGIDDEKFQKEDTIHSIFFPIRSESDDIGYDQQNLWLVDERLSYHNYLASDKPFSKIKTTDSTSQDRPDLFIFNHSFAFVNDDAPHNSYTIVEFKRPERKDYTSKTEKSNPVDQVLKYIDTIRENGATDRRGKRIHFANNANVPFYAYIIADFNSNFERILKLQDFNQTPDGMGYFKFHKTYNAYIEVITYDKVLKDAKNRNRILFDKLGIPTN